MRQWRSDPEVVVPGRLLARTACLRDLGDSLLPFIERKHFFFRRGENRGQSEVRLLTLPRTSVYGISHGGAVSVRTDGLNSYEYLFVTQGSLIAGANGVERRVMAGDGVLQGPGLRRNVRWTAGSKAIAIRIDNQSLGRYLSGGIAGQPHAPQALSLRRGLGRTLFAVCSQICDEILDGLSADELSRYEDLLHYTAARVLEQSLDAGSACSTHSRLPPYLRRAVRHIFANLREDLSARTLVRVSGVSSRTLQKGFAQHFGTSPVKFVRMTRLARVRDELLQAAPWETTVTEVANRWGFTHLSNFSRCYSLEFGETPSRTLRKQAH